jgi:hypothetical protein
VSVITPFRWQVVPVMIAAREGEQIAHALKWLLKRTPSAYSRSTWGVRTVGHP